MTVTVSVETGSAAGVCNALEVSHLDVLYRVRGRDLLTLRDVSFEIPSRESFGLVGESGCGKSTTVQAITRYLARNGRVSAGAITIAGRNVMEMGSEELRRLRAGQVSVVYQEPGRALNPSMKIGRQVAEVFELAGVARSESPARAVDALRMVQIADPGRVVNAYPHQLSGGMLQRVVIAMAIAVEPTLLILDEPTTALDATVEAEVLDLIAGLREEINTSVLFVSHNLSVIAKMCDRVGVMYAGEIVEEGPAQEVLYEPKHPYTVGLLRCVPRRGQRKDRDRLHTIAGFLPTPGQVPAGCVFSARCALADDHCRANVPEMFAIGAGRGSRCFKHSQAHLLPTVAPVELPVRPERASSEPVIRVEHLSKTYRGRGGEQVRALVDLKLELYPGETLGVVGESGCGKTTLARVMLGLTAADPGSLLEIHGRQVAPVAAGRTAAELRLLQVIFQNPDSALNRRHSVRHIITRALTKLAGLSGKDKERRLNEIVESVRMEPRHLPMRPAQLSGGLKQRVAIARAFAGQPAVLVCDEPTSALDVSVQAAILNLLADLQHREHVTYVFISHDLGVVRYLSDRIAVLYLGRLMEYGPAESVFAGPHHPYTEALLSAVPTLDRTSQQRIKLDGEIPSPANPPTGCVFHTRCPRRLTDGTCENIEPQLREVQPGKLMRCHLSLDQLGKLETQSTSLEGLS